MQSAASNFPVSNQYDPFASSLSATSDVGLAFNSGGGYSAYSSLFSASGSGSGVGSLSSVGGSLLPNPIGRSGGSTSGSGGSTGNDGSGGSFNRINNFD
jgi:hypothetical protein